MKLKIELNGEEKDIEVKGLKGKHLKKLIEAQIEIQDAEDTTKSAMNYVALMDETAAKISGLSVVELNELDVEYKKQITKYIADNMAHTMGF